MPSHLSWIDYGGADKNLDYLQVVRVFVRTPTASILGINKWSRQICVPFEAPHDRQDEHRFGYATVNIQISWYVDNKQVILY